MKTYTIDEVNRLLDVMCDCMSVGRYSLTKMPNEEYFEWVRRQLDLCGFKVHGPVGLCWIRLKENE